MSAALRDVNSGNAFALDDFNLIGRSEGATIQLVDSGISRQHATIRREGENYWLVDLGSANGSFVNDVALTAPRVLRDGDRLQFGRSVLLFDLDDVRGATGSAGGRRQDADFADHRRAVPQHEGDAVRRRSAGLHPDELAAVGRPGRRPAARVVCRLQRHPQALRRVDRQVHRRLRLRLLARHRAGQSRPRAACRAGAACRGAGIRPRRPGRCSSR